MRDGHQIEGADHRFDLGFERLAERDPFGNEAPARVHVEMVDARERFAAGMLFVAGAQGTAAADRHDLEQETVDMQARRAFPVRHEAEDFPGGGREEHDFAALFLGDGAQPFRPDRQDDVAVGGRADRGGTRLEIPTADQVQPAVLRRELFQPVGAPALDFARCSPCSRSWSFHSMKAATGLPRSPLFCWQPAWPGCRYSLAKNVSAQLLPTPSAPAA